MGFIGADVDELEDLARQFQVASGQVRRVYQEVRTRAHSSGWEGPDAERFYSDWDGRCRQLIRSASDSLAEAADRLRRNADDQRSASQAAASGPMSVVTHLPLTGEDHGGFGAGQLPRDRVADLLAAVGDTDEDEIQIRQLENGSYVVVLPGVTDLSSGLVNGGLAAVANPITGPIMGPITTATEWFTGNENNSVRDMGNAIPNGIDPDFNNEYSDRVKEAMQRAGVPAGSNVMFVGHSYGAYTAADLAADDNFNSADGTSSGYHVNVTHVLAAGAATDHYFPRIPEGTDFLVLNNRHDLAYQGEDIAHGSRDAMYPGHDEHVFDGGYKGAGHHPDNYVDWIRHHGDEDMRKWVDEAGAAYGGPGKSVNVKVHQDVPSSGGGGSW